MPPTPSYVVLDSNVLFNDARLSRPHALIVRQQAARGIFSLVIPEVVVREVVQQYPLRLRSAATSIDAAGKLFNVLGIDLAMPVVPEIDAAADAYDTDLRALAGLRGVEIGLLPEVRHERLLELAIPKLKPFQKGGKGYPDALIWMTVVEYARRGDVAFITDNHRDFGDDADHGRPALELAADLSAQFILPEAVSLYPSLKSFIDHRVPRNAQLTAALAMALASNDEFAAALAQLTQNLLTDQPVSDVPNLGIGIDSAAATIKWFDSSGLEIDEAREVEREVVAVDLVAEGTATLEFFIPKWEAWTTGDISVIEADWNETLAWASAERQIRAGIAVTLEVDGLDVLDYEISYIEPIDPRP